MQCHETGTDGLIALEVHMSTSQNGLKVLMRLCDSGTCPALFEDEAGRIFVQGNRLTTPERSDLPIPEHEEVVEISPELIAFLKSH